MCSESFYRTLNEIEKKISCFPEISEFPVIKKAGYESGFFPASGRSEGHEDENKKINFQEEKTGKSPKVNLKGRKAGNSVGSLIENTSGKASPASLSGISLSRHFLDSVKGKGKKKEKTEESKKDKFVNNSAISTDFTDTFLTMKAGSNLTSDRFFQFEDLYRGSGKYRISRMLRHKWQGREKP